MLEPINLAGVTEPLEFADYFGIPEEVGRGRISLRLWSTIERIKIDTAMTADYFGIPEEHDGE